MAKPKSNTVSEKTREEAMQVAKSIQKPGQTKEQTKLIAQGIQKGIDQYKKQQKAKAREADKLRKKQQRHSDQVDDAEPLVAEQSSAGSKLPWILLILSWIGFIAYLLSGQAG